MARRDVIAEKLTKAFAPANLEVMDEIPPARRAAGGRGNSFQGVYCGGGGSREEPGRSPPRGQRNACGGARRPRPPARAPCLSAGRRRGVPVRTGNAAP